MSTPINDWFKEAYKFARLTDFQDIILPFGFFTHSATEAEIRTIFPYELVRDQVDKMIAVSAHLSKYVPRDLDFIKEKRRLHDEVVSFLKGNFPGTRAAISFGSVAGDFDIALCNEYHPTAVAQVLARNFSTMKGIPLVDWDGLVKFNTPVGATAAYRLYEEARASRGRVLNATDISELVETQSSATLLFGDAVELASFKSYNQ